MQQYNVTGMSCAACSARVEKAVKGVPGVTECAVNLLTNSMSVDGSASTEAIVKAVTDAGYGASLKGAAHAQATAQDDSILVDTETPKLKKRLIASVGFLLVLMYFSMGAMMWGWPVPAFFKENHIAQGLLQLLLAAIIMVINQKFFISGFKGLIHRAPNMDTLVALGSAASFGWSVYALFMMTDAHHNGNMAAVMKYMDEFYFESAATILTLITVGKMLEARSKGKTTDAIKSLMKLAPKTALVVRNGVEETIPTEQVKKGDIFIVKPGESVPVDGAVIEGSSAINEAALTGESVPVDKVVGEEVSAATINQSGLIRCQATRVGEDTTLSQIIKMVNDAASGKAPIAKIADKVSGVFVPIVITIALITIGVWLALGKAVSFALARGISVLVISCPCALGLATPVAIMVGNGVGAKNGILFKTATSLEQTGKVQIAVLDKTGTITSGEPVVTDIVPVGITEQELIDFAVSIESGSEHPLAKAIVNYGTEHAAHALKTTSFTALPGNGVKAEVDGKESLAGSLKFIEAKLGGLGELKGKAEECAEGGKTPLLFARDGKLVGLIAVADSIKKDSAEAVGELKKLGIRVVMLTGDNEKTAKAIGREAGVDEIIAGVLPSGKEEVVRKLKKQGMVMMVGDGINDAPALTRADIGVAIGAGADVAIDAADVVLMKSKLRDVPAAIRLSRETLKNIHQNLFWAFFYNVIGIPIAAGCFVWCGLTLNPMFGAAAMSLSSFFVVSNALRLNLVKIYDSKRDKAIKNSNEIEKLEVVMENKKTMVIEGMMCGHCEASVKKALEALDGVESAEVSHEAGTAIVTLSGDVTNDTLKAAVEAKDYVVKSVE